MKDTPNRRSFLQRAGLAGMTLPGWSQTSSPNRPNVLLIMTDQQTDGAMSCTGNPHVNTPAIDRIAAREQLFDLEADPGEITNLTADPAHRSALSEHRQLISDWATGTNDSFPLVKAG